MNISQIVLFVFLPILCLIGLFLLSRHRLDKRASKYEVIGKTVRWQNSKLPFLGRIVVEYNKKGNTFQTPSCLMFKPKTLKPGTKHRWTIYTYRAFNGVPIFRAKRYKSKSETPSPPSSPFSTIQKK